MIRQASRVLAMVRRWFGGGVRDRTLDAELESFLEHEIDARVESGMTAEDARRTAFAAFGGVQQVKEQAHEARLGAGLEALVRDLRYAARTIRRSAGLSLAVVGSLSVGIAVMGVANAFINAWLFRDFPGITDQKRLVQVEIRRLPNGRPPGNVMNAPADYLSLDASDAFYQRLLDGVSRLPDVDAVGLARRTAVWTFGTGKGPSSVVVWAPGREAEVVNGGYAGGVLFGALGLRLIAGRTFTAADATAGPQVAVVNDAYAELLPERQALGRAIRVKPYVQSQRMSDEAALAASREVTIVGVIESPGERRYTRDGRPVGKIYLPSPLGPEPALTLYARSRGKAEVVAPSIRDLASRIDPRVPIVEMGSLRSFNERSMGPGPWLGPDLGAARRSRARAGRSRPVRRGFLFRDAARAGVCDSDGAWRQSARSVAVGGDAVDDDRVDRVSSRRNYRLSRQPAAPTSERDHGIPGSCSRFRRPLRPVGTVPLAAV